MNMDALKGMANKLKSGDKGSSGEDKGDYVDRGVGMVGKQFGQNFSREEEEKYSDLARQGYKSATGKDIPIKDQDVQSGGQGGDAAKESKH